MGSCTPCAGIMPGASHSVPFSGPSLDPSAVGTKSGRWGPGPRCEARGIVSRGPKKVIPCPTRSLPACARVFRTVEGPTDCGDNTGWGGGMRGRSCCPLLAAECLGIRWASTAPLVVIGGNSAPLGEKRNDGWGSGRRERACLGRTPLSSLVRLRGYEILPRRRALTGL